MKYNRFFILLLCLWAFPTWLSAQVVPFQKYTSYSEFSDDEKRIFDTVQFKTFQYFWEGAEPNSGLARERIHLDGDYPDKDQHIITTGGSGFGVMAVMVGYKRGWITLNEMLSRYEKNLTFLEKCDRFHGAWPHWLDGNTGKVKPFSPKDDGGDLVESSFLMQGLLSVQQILSDEVKRGNIPKNKRITNINKRIEKLWREIEFDWYTKGEDVLYWHWSPNHGWAMNFAVKGYNECLIMYILAASSPTHPIEPRVYHYGWAGANSDHNNADIKQISDNQKQSYYPLQLRHQGDLRNGGPLFWAHYSFVALNPMGLEDKYADYGSENINQTLNNYLWCVNNPMNFRGYSDSSWGLTASYSVNFYSGHAPDSTRDEGVISPTAAISSFPYTPALSLKCLSKWYNDKPELLKKYGFIDAFSDHKNWSKPWYLAIDQGPMVVMMENARTGLFWNQFRLHKDVQRGLKLLGFRYSGASGLTLDQKIKAQISELSLTEKVGQMTQIDLGLIAKGDICALQQPQTLDSQKLAVAFGKYKVGSVLNVGCGSGTISLARWHSIINDIQGASLKSSNHGIYVIYGIDAIHGANYTMGATLFPQQIGQAASWNPSLVGRAAQITAHEVRASGIPWNFSPVLDLGRQPLWSRFFETYGEDVFLAKSMTKAAITGYQNNGMNNSVAACMKHFLGYSYPLSGKDRTPAWIDDRTLREYYLPTFETAIKAGAKTVMINSGEINGTPVHINKDILTGLLRVELGFKGVAVTDWEDIYKLNTTHKVASTLKEAVKMAINAGIDMSMTPSDFQFNDLLIELVEEGEVPMSRIDEAVYRILKLKYELGLVGEFPQIPQLEVGTKEFTEINYQAAVESITLLKNDGNVLPLKNSSVVQNTVIMGNAANNMDLINGAWTHSWQGINNGYRTKGKITIAEALTEYTQESKNDEKVLVYCLGEKPATEVPGNINDLSIEIPADDLKFLQEWKSKGGKSVLVLCLARPRIITPYVSLFNSVIHAYLPGDEGGRAIADIIYGKQVPSGKLPFTYPKFAGDVVHYDRKHTENNDVNFGRNAYQPLFDFGWGMSYTNFEYSNFEISRKGDSLMLAKVTVRNSGNYDAKEVVQLYASDLYASITPSVKKLVGFNKVFIKKNESVVVEIPFSKAELTFINKDLQRVFEGGEFTFSLGCEGYATDEKITLDIR